MPRMTAEEAAEWGKSLSFEKVWAAIMETDRITKENSEEIKRMNAETAAQMKRSSEETDRKFAESAAQMKRSSEETDRKFAESAAQMKRSSEELDRIFKDNARQIRKVSKNIGGINRSFGKWTEQMVAPKLWKKFDALEYVFTKGGLNMKFWENGRVIAEVDIFLENGIYVMLVEVKTDLTTEDVDEHLKRIETVRYYMDGHSDKRIIVAAVAGAIVPDNVCAYAQKKGLYVLAPSGDSIAVADLPEGFTPKKW